MFSVFVTPLTNVTRVVRTSFQFEPMLELRVFPNKTNMLYIPTNKPGSVTVARAAVATGASG